MFGGGGWISNVCICLSIIPGELFDLDVFGFGLEPLLFRSFFSGDDGSDSVFTQTNIALSTQFALVVLPAAPLTSLASTLFAVSFF